MHETNDRSPGGATVRIAKVLSPLRGFHPFRLAYPGLRSQSLASPRANIGRPSGAESQVPSLLLNPFVRERFVVPRMVGCVATPTLPLVVKRHRFKVAPCPDRPDSLRACRER